MERAGGGYRFKWRVREGLHGKVTFEQRLKEVREDLWRSVGRASQAVGTARAKALRWECAWNTV